MGVLRDIHQNHLTELLTLITMELPSSVKDPEDLTKRKLDLLRQVESVKTPASLFGQYADYAKHASLHLPNDTKTADVPTFAATMVRINSARWKGIPFLLVSGKQLDKRESYVKVVFKDTNVCISHCQTAVDAMQSQPIVVFQIGHGGIPNPAIIVSKSFGQPVWPDNVVQFEKLDSLNMHSIYQTPVNKLFVGAVVKDTPAYQSVIADLVNGVENHFVTTKCLLLSWHIWDYVVSVSKFPRIYQPGDPEGSLNFRFFDHHMEFEHLGVIMSSREVPIQHSQALFLGRKLVTASASQLPPLLARTVGKQARDEIRSKGSFHIAFSGGSTASPLLRSLANEFVSLPWESIHAWQVDERCVPHHDPLSNFGLLDRELFQHVNIPFSNIHALPVDVAGELCDESLGSAHLYTESIKNLVQNAQFDMVILGVGPDGHTAGLFPGSTALHVDSDTFVTISNDGPEDSRRRMSLTLPIINRSKQIAVLVTGSHKRNILQQLETSNSLDKYPILGVHPKNGTITWYIDELALS